MKVSLWWAESVSAWINVGMSGSFVLFPGWAAVFLVWQTVRMGERAARDPPAAISPTQQMVASSTGALLTSIFGESQHTKTWGGQSFLSLIPPMKAWVESSSPPSSLFVLVDWALCMSSFVLLCFQSRRWTWWRSGYRPSRRPSTKVSLCFCCRLGLSTDALLALLRLSLMPFTLFQTFASSPLCFRSFTLHAGTLGKPHSALQVWVSTTAAKARQNLKWPELTCHVFPPCAFSCEDRQADFQACRVVFPGFLSLQ